ncbi:hypothetical protein DXG01_005919 [Tephrocybe rancida]|nr:hypothetical protein DXG01_005919 [Tephrocybe rancida]
MLQYLCRLPYRADFECDAVICQRFCRRFASVRILIPEMPARPILSGSSEWDLAPGAWGVARAQDVREHTRSSCWGLLSCELEVWGARNAAVAGARGEACILKVHSGKKRTEKKKEVKKRGGKNNREGEKKSRAEEVALREETAPLNVVAVVTAILACVAPSSNSDASNSRTLSNSCASASSRPRSSELSSILSAVAIFSPPPPPPSPSNSVDEAVVRGLPTALPSPSNSIRVLPAPGPRLRGLPTTPQSPSNSTKVPPPPPPSPSNSVDDAVVRGLPTTPPSPSNSIKMPPPPPPSPSNSVDDAVNRRTLAAPAVDYTSFVPPTHQTQTVIPLLGEAQTFIRPDGMLADGFYIYELSLDRPLPPFKRPRVKVAKGDIVNVVRARDESHPSLFVGVVQSFLYYPFYAGSRMLLFDIVDHASRKYHQTMALSYDAADASLVALFESFARKKSEAAKASINAVLEASALAASAHRHHTTIRPSAYLGPPARRSNDTATAKSSTDHKLTTPAAILPRACGAAPNPTSPPSVAAVESSPLSMTAVESSPLSIAAVERLRLHCYLCGRLTKCQGGAGLVTIDGRNRWVCRPGVWCRPDRTWWESIARWYRS